MIPSAVRTYLRSLPPLALLVAGGACGDSSGPAFGPTPDPLRANEVAFDALGNTTILIGIADGLYLVEGTAGTLKRIERFAGAYPPTLSHYVLSPDASTIAFQQYELFVPSPLFTFGVTDTTRIKLAEYSTFVFGPPSWTTDGLYVLFALGTGFNPPPYPLPAIYRTRANGSRAIEPIVTFDADPYGPNPCPSVAGLPRISAAPSGDMAFTCGNAVYRTQGGLVYAATPPNGVWSASFSPDGTRLAFIEGMKGSGYIRVVNLATNALEASIPMLPSGDAYYYAQDDVCWTRDGTRVVFTMGEDSTRSDVYVAPATGGPAQRITSRGNAWELSCAR